MKTISELVEQNRIQHEEVVALAKGKPLRFVIWGIGDDPDAIVSVIAPGDSLERYRGFVGKPSSRGLQVHPYDETIERALTYLLSYGHSFSLFTSPTLRFFIMKSENGWSVTAKGLYEDGSIGVWSAGDGHLAEAVCGLVKSLTDSLAGAGTYTH